MGPGSRRNALRDGGVADVASTRNKPRRDSSFSSSLPAAATARNSYNSLQKKFSNKLQQVSPSPPAVQQGQHLQQRRQPQQQQAQHRLSVKQRQQTPTHAQQQQLQQQQRWDKSERQETDSRKQQKPLRETRASLNKMKKQKKNLNQGQQRFGVADKRTVAMTGDDIEGSYQAAKVVQKEHVNQKAATGTAAARPSGTGRIGHRQLFQRTHSGAPAAPAAAPAAAAAPVSAEAIPPVEEHVLLSRGQRGSSAAAGASAAGKNAEKEEEEEKDEEVNEEENQGDADPYLLAEAEYLRSESRWVNRQRVLILSSRGVSSLQRKLMDDFKKLLPHHKAEAKWEKKQGLREIVELAQLRACNNVLFFESRKRDLLLHVAKLPHGPTAIFRVLNIHTLGEMKLTGNCLLHSRPFLLFDPIFDSETQPHWRLLKELFVQVFGTPRNHPKAKPFFDHAMAFYKFDGNKLWFRHYQIAPLVPGSTGDANKPERQTFVEIGPRCVFEAVKILDDAFGGRTIWSNDDFVPTRDIVALQRMQTATEYAARIMAKEKREERKEKMKGREDPLSFENVFGQFLGGTVPRPYKRQKIAF